MDLVALAEDEGGHLRVPEAGLMSEMDSRLQHLSHGHAGHEKLLFGLSLRASLAAILDALKAVQGHPAAEVSMRVWSCVAKKGRALYHEDLVGTMSYALASAAVYLPARAPDSSRICTSPSRPQRNRKRCAPRAAWPPRCST